MYLMSPETFEAIKGWLEIIKPGIERAEINALLQSKFRGLHLEGLPLKKSVFIFDTALLDVQAAIKMKDTASLASSTWIPLIVQRLNEIDVRNPESHDRLKKLMTYISEMEVRK